jgi:hypothetical protein
VPRVESAITANVLSVADLLLYSQSVRELAVLLNEMRAAGVITDYALFGAAAQMRYTEPVATLDAGVLIGVPSPDRLDLLAPVYDFCARKGYLPEGEAIRVGAWPVQFVPAFDGLVLEAMKEADTADFEGVPMRVVRADYLALIALNTGRAKDFARVLALLESRSTSAKEITRLAERHKRLEKWKRFETRFLQD